MKLNNKRGGSTGLRKISVILRVIIFFPVVTYVILLSLNENYSNYGNSLYSALERRTMYWFLQFSETFHLSKPNIIPHIQFNVNLQNSAANLSSPLQSNSTTVLHETTKIRKVEVGKEFKKKDEFRSPNKVFNKK